jgi:PTH1 family peptidyl-tRNA hydrolase
MKWIIGLGNPGDDYTNTRHNVGFLILSHIQAGGDFTLWEKNKYLNAEISTGRIGETDYTLVKPQTFMNLSGDVVLKLIKKDVKSINIVVIYDDLAFPFGTVRLACEKGDGGHNGIKSIAGVLKDESWIRVRIGIHSYIPEVDEPTLVPLVGVDRADFVLKDFRKDEQEELKTISHKVVSILESIEHDGLAKTMTQFNQK